MAGIGQLGKALRGLGKKGSRKVGPHTISPEGEKEISIQELIDKNRERGMTSEEATDAAERAVNQDVSGAELPKSSVWDRLKTGVDDDFNPIIPGKTKALAGGAAVAGTGLALSGDDGDIDVGKTPDKIEDKSIKDQEKDAKIAEKSVTDEKTLINQEISKLLAGADASQAASMPMPGAHRPYKFDRTDFSEDLKEGLEDIGSKYEVELAQLEDKKEAGESRAEMKALFKGLIDAAALIYLAKHAPSATETYSKSSSEEYTRELARLDRHMNDQRNLIKDKFSELRGQIKDRYKTVERGEDKAEQAYSRDRGEDYKYQSDVYRAKSDMFKASQRAGQGRDTARLKELQKRRALIEKDEKPAKPDITVKQQADLENKTKANIHSFITNIETGSSETLAADLRNMGATPGEVTEFIKAKEAGFIESPEDALEFLPSSSQLTIRQLSGIRGTEAPVADTPVTKIIKGKLHRKVSGGWIPVE